MGQCGRRSQMVVGHAVSRTGSIAPEKLEVTINEASRLSARMLRTAAVGQLINAVESAANGRQYAPGGVLRGRAQYSRTSRLPKRFRVWLDTEQAAWAIHSLNIAGPVLTLTARGRRKQLIAASAVSFLANKLFEVRNPYGRDGSDQMQTVLHGYRLVSALVPNAERGDDLYLRAVNSQVFLSYFMSGLAKLISSDWRSGEATGMIMKTDLYGGTALAEVVQRYPLTGKVISWSTVAWECSYPAIYLLPPRAIRPALVAVKVFHLSIAYSMGLPRFFWNFSAAHTAVQYVTQEVNR
jgi:hypothetical protein